MPHQITIVPSGHQCSADAGETVLQAALKAGYLIPYNCRNGTCGACKGKVLQGRVDLGKAVESVLLPAEREAGDVLFCCATPLTDITIQCREFDAPGEIKVKKLLCRVNRMVEAAPDVMVLHLELPAGKRMQFLAGQYIDILLSDGRRRAFSLANAPGDDEMLELHIRRIPGGEFTSHVFEELRLRDQLRIDGPHGNFYLRPPIAGDGQRPTIMIAGGTGFAPVKSMLQDAIQRGLDHPIHVYWGSRRPNGLYMDDLASAWSAEHPNIHYIPVVSEPQPEDHWQGRTGLVHHAVEADWPDLSACDVYVCGSEQMTTAARQDFIAHGLPSDHLYCDVFCAAREQTTTG